MKKYLCHSCAQTKGHLQSIQTGSLLETYYQRSKYMKHTAPAAKYPTQSVFDSPSTQSYQDYVVSSSLSGSVEFDEGGRPPAIIWAAGKEIGFRYEGGELKQPEDCVKVVLSTDTGKIHAYSQSSTQFHSASCSECDGAVLY